MSACQPAPAPRRPAQLCGGSPEQECAHLQDGPPVLGVKRRMRFRATSKIGDGVIKPGLGWDFQ